MIILYLYLGSSLDIFFHKANNVMTHCRIPDSLSVIDIYLIFHFGFPLIFATIKQRITFLYITNRSAYLHIFLKNIYSNNSLRLETNVLYTT